MVIKSTRIYTEAGCVDGYVEVARGRIQRIIPVEQARKAEGHVFDVGDNRVIPGIIDIHTHGGGGWVAKDSDNPDEIRNLARHYASRGIACFLATASLWSIEKMCDTISFIADTMESGNTPGAKILGIHLEAPFFNHEKSGAGFQTPEWMPNPSVEVAKRFVTAGRGHLRYLTLAPELPGAEETIKYLTSAGVRVAAGHTNATYDELIRGVDWGVSSIAHAGNAIRMIHQREPGVLGAMLLEDRLFCELICDFIHLHPQFVRLVINNKGTDRIVMVADTSDMAGMETGIYDTKPRVTEMTPEGVVYIYGSDVMNGSSKYVLNGVENLVERLGYPIEEVAKMSSLNAARLLGMERERGSIRVGKYGDFTILTDDYEVLYTISEGVVVYDAQRDDACLNPELLKLKRR